MKRDPCWSSPFNKFLQQISQPNIASSHTNFLHQLPNFRSRQNGRYKFTSLIAIRLFNSRSLSLSFLSSKVIYIKFIIVVLKILSEEKKIVIWRKYKDHHHQKEIVCEGTGQRRSESNLYGHIEDGTISFNDSVCSSRRAILYSKI